MACISSTYKVCNIYTGLHNTEICPPVQSKTVYMDFCNEGYLVHTFEIVQAKPSVSVVNQLKVTRPAEFLCDIYAAIATPDISLVEVPRPRRSHVLAHAPRRPSTLPLLRQRWHFVSQQSLLHFLICYHHLPCLMKLTVIHIHQPGCVMYDYMLLTPALKRNKLWYMDRSPTFVTDNWSHCSNA